MSRKRGPKPSAAARRRTQQKWWWIAGASGLVLAIIGVVLWRTSAAQPEQTQDAANIGPLNTCIRNPSFTQQLGFTQGAALDTQMRSVPGIVLYQPGPDGSPLSNPPPYQHPSWVQAGYLGPLTFDRDGAVYVLPVPWINTLLNPPEAANRVYRIDPRSAEMAMLVDLPMAQPPHTNNVYGVMGLTYDCETHSLYVSSVAGSTRAEQFGRIFRVDLQTKAVTIVREGVDAFGLGVFRGVSGKRLYFAMARDSQVFSVALDEAGNAVGEPRFELDFVEYGVRSNERARRLNFGRDLRLGIPLIQFDFTLTAPTDPRTSTIYYAYDAETDRFTLEVE